jgi:hypothetical protein
MLALFLGMFEQVQIKELLFGEEVELEWMFG